MPQWSPECAVVGFEAQRVFYFSQIYNCSNGKNVATFYALWSQLSILDQGHCTLINEIFKLCKLLYNVQIKHGSKEFGYAYTVTLKYGIYLYDIATRSCYTTGSWKTIMSVSSQSHLPVRSCDLNINVGYIIYAL